MNILVVSPHPDDETLGAGGTICRYVDEGHDVFWLNITTMRNSGLFTEDMMQHREKQIEDIVKFYDIKKFYQLDFPTTKLEEIDTSLAIGKISRIINEIKPEIIILPDYNDAHSDHKYVFDWCYACTKTFRYPYVRQVMTMEILSETDFGRPENPFLPNYYVDISNYMNDKLDALKIYDTELGEPPFPRSLKNVEALASLRGAAAGVLYAEAFRLLKKIY